MLNKIHVQGHLWKSQRGDLLFRYCTGRQLSGWVRHSSCVSHDPCLRCSRPLLLPVSP